MLSHIALTQPLSYSHRVGGPAMMRKLGFHETLAPNRAMSSPSRMGVGGDNERGAMGWCALGKYPDAGGENWEKTRDAHQRDALHYWCTAGGRNESGQSVGRETRTFQIGNVKTALGGYHPLLRCSFWSTEPSTEYEDLQVRWFSERNERVFSCLTRLRHRSEALGSERRAMKHDPA